MRVVVRLMVLQVCEGAPSLEELVDDPRGARSTRRPGGVSAPPWVGSRSGSPAAERECTLPAEADAAGDEPSPARDELVSSAASIVARRWRRSH